MAHRRISRDRNEQKRYEESGGHSHKNVHIIVPHKYRVAKCAVAVERVLGKQKTIPAIPSRPACFSVRAFANGFAIRRRRHYEFAFPRIVPSWPKIRRSLIAIVTKKSGRPFFEDCCTLGLEGWKFCESRRKFGTIRYLKTQCKTSRRDIQRTKGKFNWGVRKNFTIRTSYYYIANIVFCRILYIVIQPTKNVKVNLCDPIAKIITINVIIYRGFCY